MSKLYTPNDASCEVIHFNCKQAKGKYKGMDATIFRGTGCAKVKFSEKVDDFEYELFWHYDKEIMELIK